MAVHLQTLMAFAASVNKVDLPRSNECSCGAILPAPYSSAPGSSQLWYSPPSSIFQCAGLLTALALSWIPYFPALLRPRPFPLHTWSLLLCSFVHALSLAPDTLFFSGGPVGPSSKPSSSAAPSPEP